MLPQLFNAISDILFRHSCHHKPPHPISCLKPSQLLRHQTILSGINTVYTPEDWITTKWRRHWMRETREDVGGVKTNDRLLEGDACQIPSSQISHITQFPHSTFMYGFPHLKKRFCSSLLTNFPQTPDPSLKCGLHPNTQLSQIGCCCQITQVRQGVVNGRNMLGPNNGVLGSYRTHLLLSNCQFLCTSNCPLTLMWWVHHLICASQ